MTERRIIDSDGHILEDVSEIITFLPEIYHGANRPIRAVFPPLDHLHINQGVVPPGAFGGGRRIGPSEWIEFLDSVGIESTVLYPTSGLAIGRITSDDWAIDTARAYNDWLYNTYLQKSPRLKGMALIPMQDPQAAVEEMRRAVLELGMCGVMAPSNGLPNHLGSTQYWPVYEAANELGCPIALHGGCHHGFGFDDINVFAEAHAIGHPLGMVIGLGSLVFNGIFDRFPNVRFAFLEGGVAWFLLCLERFQGSYQCFTPFNPRRQLLELRPGQRLADYIIGLAKNGQIFIGCEGDEPDLAYAIKKIGPEPFLYSSDFPHEVNNESCKEELEELIESEELSQSAKEAVLFRNAERFYNLGALVH